MILLILGVSIVIIVVCNWLYLEKDIDCCEYLVPIGWVFSIISAFVAIVLAISVSRLSVIDERIAMYQEENTKIELQIADIVEQYQKYETDIFMEIAPDSAVTLVSLYPELKSDTLVQSQIEVYTENNKMIKTLRDKQINGSIYRWWLYFGCEK